jgi:hypothetical protein
MPTKCNCCQGTFSPIEPDGSHYYHACGPLPNPAYQPDPTKGAVNLVQTIERPGKVDQNVTGYDPVTKQPILVSPGLGTALV